MVLRLLCVPEDKNAKELRVETLGNPWQPAISKNTTIAAELE